MRTKLHPSRSGFSLVELVIAFTVLSLILGSIGMVGIAGRDAYQEGLNSATLETRARNALERVASELTAGVQGTLTAAPALTLGASSIQFQACQGWAGGAMILGTRTSIVLESDPTDANNGVDDDNDGFVDERQLVLVRDAGQPDEVRAILCRNVRELMAGETPNMLDDNGNGLVDESGFCVSDDGQGTLRLRLSIEARDPKNNLVVRTLETSVHMRN